MSLLLYTDHLVIKSAAEGTSPGKHGLKRAVKGEDNSSWDDRDGGDGCIRPL